VPASFGATDSDTPRIVGDGPNDPLVRMGHTALLPLLVSHPRELDGAVSCSIVAAFRFAQPSQHCELVDVSVVDDDRAVGVDDLSIATP
jgi:hypothetical protein